MAIFQSWLPSLEPPRRSLGAGPGTPAADAAQQCPGGIWWDCTKHWDFILGYNGIIILYSILIYHNIPFIS